MGTDKERFALEGIGEKVEEMVDEGDEKDDAFFVGLSTDGEVGEEEEMRVMEVKAVDSIVENPRMYELMVTEDISSEVLEVSPI